MSYPDYARQAVRQNENDADLFASVGLYWLSSISKKNADRIRENKLNINKTKSPS